MDWDEIKFCVGLTIIFSFFLYVRLCDMIIISISLFIYSCIINVNSYLNRHGVKSITNEDAKELSIKNAKENVSLSNNYEQFSGDFHGFYNFDNTEDSSSCTSQGDDFEQNGDFSGNRDSVNNRWSSFKSGVMKYICCCCSPEEKD